MSDRAVMERSLYEASMNGNVKELDALMEEDELILDRVSLTRFDETPLHVAALRGHLNFTRALLSRKPKLATELDSLRCSPLHLASAEGHIEIVRELLKANTEVCKARDHDGRTPLHLAAMKGRVEVMGELILARHESISERIGRGETVLHLSVKYNRLEALKTFVQYLQSNNMEFLVISADDDGNTILHLAVALKQMETIEYLFGIKIVKEHANIKNQNGSTAFNVLEHCPNRDLKSMEIREFLLLQAGVERRARDPQTQQPCTTGQEIMKSSPDNNHHPQTCCNARQSISMFWNNYIRIYPEWLKEVRGHLITAATLTATMAYQAGISPPGGVRQDVGTSILASYNPRYVPFLICNTVSLMGSLSTILLALSGFPPKNKLFMCLLMITIYGTIIFMGFAYTIAVAMTTPDFEVWPAVIDLFIISSITLIGISLFVIFLHACRLLIWLGKKCQKLVQKILWPRRRLPNNIPAIA